MNQKEGFFRHYDIWEFLDYPFHSVQFLSFCLEFDFLMKQLMN